MTQVRLMTGECLGLLRQITTASVDSLVTDPPAGISFMGKKWDTDQGGRESWIAAMVPIARECVRVLKSGAHGVVWALPRTSHWTATAFEDAGFEIRDAVTHHFGTGYPKSKSLLKPASEHWILVRAPGTPRKLEIDACRVRGNVDEMRGRSGTAKVGNKILGAGIRNPNGGLWEPNNAGRWPANVMFSHREECGDACVAGCPVQSLDSQSGGASRFFYCSKPSAKERQAGLSGTRLFNSHPTVKSIGLMTWLIKLVTRPGGTVLDPFMGSGTTGCAAIKNGFGFIGIEREKEYAQIAGARIRHWTT